MPPLSRIFLLILASALLLADGSTRLPAQPAPPEPGSPVVPGEAEKAAAALAILDPWHATDPKPGKRLLHIVSWRPKDRDFPENQEERLPRIMRHIQDFYSREMARNGLGERTFPLDEDADGKLVIHRVTGEGNYADYGRPDGSRIRKECVPVLKEAGIDPDRETILIFTSLAEWDPEKKTFFHKSPYYASGSHRAGTAWQLDSPELDTRNLGLREPIIQDGEYGRISLGKHNSIFIGGIAHEMGHAFSLPHCRERADEKAAWGTALMGSGNRSYGDEIRGEGKGSFITLAHALRLASHPQFSGSVKGMNLPTNAEFLDLSVKEAGAGFVVSGKIRSSLPTYAIVAYLDPEGGGDYDSHTSVAIPGEDGSFVMNCEALVAGKPAALRLVACLVNGSTHTWQGSYAVEKDGTLDISAMQLSLELEEFTTALRDRDREKAKALRDGLEEGSRGRAIADAVLDGTDPDRRMISVKDVPTERTSFPLSRIQPTEASVGWARPAYDHVPSENPLLRSGSRIYETGIYAHAEARHRYDLAGSGWKKLTGQCGLPIQRGGSVVFVILVDGKEVYRSPKTQPGNTHSYEIDLEGATSLELVTEDAGDGKGSDWGLWLEPILTR